MEIDSDVWKWEETIIALWRDLYLSHLPHRLYIVRPDPRPDPMRRRAAHVILVQDCPQSHAAILLSNVVAAAAGIGPGNSAVIVPVLGDRRSYLAMAFPGITRALMDQSHLCYVNYNGYQEVTDEPFTVASGGLIETFNIFHPPLIDNAIHPCAIIRTATFSAAYIAPSRLWSRW